MPHSAGGAVYTTLLMSVCKQPRRGRKQRERETQGGDEGSRLSLKVKSTTRKRWMREHKEKGEINWVTVRGEVKGKDGGSDIDN